MIYSLYRGLTTISGPMLTHYLKKRLKRGKEHPTRFRERFGEAGCARPAGKLVWLHGASVGEAVSLLPLINAIRKAYPDYQVLLTTGTVTSANLIATRLPEGVVHQFVPVDRLSYVRKFLDHWQPDVAIWAESELWPNLLIETRKRGVKMALVNGRMSDGSLKTWRKLKGFIATLLRAFDLCLAQAEQDAQRFEELGAQNVTCPGNLKYASPDLPYEKVELQRLQSDIGRRPVWLAASTHAGEEERIADVHRQLKEVFPDLLTMIAPRHPERGNEIVARLQEQGFSIAQRSRHNLITPKCDIYVADTMGELGLFYRLCPIVFMGKSLLPLGGQNPLEPARLNCALMCGPHMSNFVEMTERFTKAEAILVVADEKEMVSMLKRLFNDPAECENIAGRAKQVAYAQARVLDETMVTLAQLFKG